MDEFSQPVPGKITVHGNGLGIPSREDVEKRAREIALIDERAAKGGAKPKRSAKAKPAKAEVDAKAAKPVKKAAVKERPKGSLTEFRRVHNKVHNNRPPRLNRPR